MSFLMLQVYFGGGSVSLATPEGCWHALKCEPAQALTDGTPDFLGAAALVHAYDFWDKTLGGMEVSFTRADGYEIVSPTGHEKS